jgi:outer membrane protein OmpA-like peptidoglycan-associated protein
MAVVRNYEAALAGLGAVRIDTAAPGDAALIAANGDAAKLRARLRIDSADVPYAAYLVRAPGKNIWVALMAADDHANLVVVDEQAMQQSVALVTADAMRTELAAKGHMALYIHFDTDQATIRSDGKPAIAEIATLLKKDATLKLAIEGHTDNSGDAKHNLALSRERADAVVQTLVSGGIDSARLRAAGRGAAEPLADNKDEAGRAKNRRVELVKI